MTRIKFCGMTSPADVALAVEAGADAVGIICAPSERRVTLERAAEIARAIPPFVAGFAVVDAARDDGVAPALYQLGLTLQFAGAASPDTCARQSAGRRYVKVLRVAADGTLDGGLREFGPCDYGDALLLLDAAVPGRLGGSGVAFAWEFARTLARERPIAVAGGLTPGNVGACVRTLRPYAVDVRSGVERAGHKDAALMRAFVRAVRNADADS
jgi:phosphoribosylanthranilate isomerase